MRGDVPTLDAGEIDQVTKPSIAERFWERIPVFGWWIASVMWTSRYRPLRRRLFHQLESRSESALEAWQGDPEFRRFVAEVCQIAKEEMGWPCARFVPWDPYRAVFWSFDDGLDLECAMQKIEERFGIPDFRVVDVERWAKGNLGAFVTEQFGRRTVR